MGTRTWETTRTNSDYLWEGPARSIPTIKWLQPVRSICQTDYQGTKNARRDKGLHHGTREANKYSSSSKSTPGVIHGAPFLFQTSSYQDLAPSLLVSVGKQKIGNLVNNMCTGLSSISWFDLINNPICIILYFRAHSSAPSYYMRIWCFWDGIQLLCYCKICQNNAMEV